jgi:hypothetical protein
MTEKQQRRVDSFKRRVSVKGVVEPGPDDTTQVVTIGWERTRDGRDMTTLIDADGRTISTTPTYSHGAT